MKLILGALKLGLLMPILAWALADAPDASRVVHFRDGIDVTLTFAHGPAVTPSSKYESVVLLEITYNSTDGKRVRDVVFDATMEMGRYSHALSSNRAPVAVPLSPGRAWQIRNIFFTMEKKWEGKLTLKYDDGTAETQHFPITVRPR